MQGRRLPSRVIFTLSDDAGFANRNRLPHATRLTSRRYPIEHSRSAGRASLICPTPVFYKPSVVGVRVQIEYPRIKQRDVAPGARLRISRRCLGEVASTKRRQANVVKQRVQAAADDGGDAWLGSIGRNLSAIRRYLMRGRLRPGRPDARHRIEEV